jgi:hypothetical protein
MYERKIIRARSIYEKRDIKFCAELSMSLDCAKNMDAAIIILNGRNNGTNFLNISFKIITPLIKYSLIVRYLQYTTRFLKILQGLSKYSILIIHHLKPLYKTPNILKAEIKTD